MSDEWTTVTSKKGGNGYVPPHLRAKAAAEAAEAEKKKPIDIKNTAMFPSLGGPKAPSSSSNSWSGPVSFKEKIDELIAYEARTEQEKEAAEEARRALEGFVSLPLKITPEFIKKYNDTLAAAIQREIEQETNGCAQYWADSPYTVLTTEAYTEYDTDDE